jgi:Flp pilus assembly protein TadD
MRTHLPKRTGGCRTVAVGLILAGVSLGLAGCQQGGPLAVSAEKEANAEWLMGSDRPPSAQTLHSMARVFASQGRDAEAEFVLKKVMADHPGFMPAYVELAEIHMRRRQVESAIGVLEAGLAVSPGDAVLLNNVGMCWTVKKDYKRALGFFSKSAAADPDNARYRGNMAMAVGMQGRYDEALTLYRQVLTPANAHYNVGVLCEARGDVTRAFDEYAKAKELEAQE